MNINYEDSLLDETDELEDGIDSTEECCTPGKLDARRLVERRKELLLLRELLDDPSFELDY